MNIQGRDIPIVLLRPRHERKITKRERERIKAGILAVGLIEPFLVFPENDYYIILNGHQRYRILLEMGVETVPCIFCAAKGSIHQQSDGESRVALSRRPYDQEVPRGTR